MLRVGLTGGLGSGKSTIAAMFAARGAHVLSADEIGRQLMQPGTVVYDDVVAAFGPQVVRADRTLDRAALARAAFATGRLDQLNAIIHPAVIAEQERRAQTIFAADPAAIVVIESALIFEASRGANVPGWRDRFDFIILVTAPDELKLSRFVDRIAAGRTLTPEETAAIEADGRARLAAQIPDREKIPHSDFVLDNSCSLATTADAVERIWSTLQARNRHSPR